MLTVRESWRTMAHAHRVPAPDHSGRPGRAAPLGAIQSAACRPGPTSPDPAACRRRHRQHRDRRAGRGLQAHRDRLPRPVRAPRAGRPARPAPTGPTPDRPTSPPRRDPAAYAHPTPTQTGGHALVNAAAGPRTRRQSRHRGPHLARVPGAALAGRDLQVLHRPAAGGQGPRRRRAVPASARAGGRALRG